MDSNTLIEAVRVHPSLYSKKHSSSNNSDQKNAIWNQIAEEMNQPVGKCKAKWRNLRDSYQKSVKWRRELEVLGKLSSYHEYKHEAALAFLEVGIKRKSNFEGETRSPKVSKVDMVLENVYIENHDQAVEYLIESETVESERPIEYEDEEISIHSNYKEDEQFDSQHLKVETAEIDEQEFLNYETTNIADNAESSQHDDIPYQESFINESQISHTNTIEIDSWLSSIKETLLSLPKLTRARTKKQINDLISEVEIKYLESIEGDRK